MFFCFFQSNRFLRSMFNVFVQSMANLSIQLCMNERFEFEINSPAFFTITHQLDSPSKKKLSWKTVLVICPMTKSPIYWLLRRNWLFYREGGGDITNLALFAQTSISEEENHSRLCMYFKEEIIENCLAFFSSFHGQPLAANDWL